MTSRAVVDPYDGDAEARRSTTTRNDCDASPTSIHPSQFCADRRLAPHIQLRGPSNLYANAADCYDVTGELIHTGCLFVTESDDFPLVPGNFFETPSTSSTLTATRTSEVTETASGTSAAIDTPAVPQQPTVVTDNEVDSQAPGSATDRAAISGSSTPSGLSAGADAGIVVGTLVYASEEQSTHTGFRAQNTTSPPINVISPSPPVSQWGLQDEYSSIEHRRSLGLARPGQAYIDRHRVQSVAPTEVTDTTESSWRTWQVDQSRATQKKDWKRSMFF
ncbi:hypothetical protein ACCO45_002616 [Purpureocillium lilacinum]|uniref:Uncharacterized protein n=1 Tax=Purpureocillium lilacinum TaxID=33203 RepID=A0ACC4EBH2_PURLI